MLSASPAIPEEDIDTIGLQWLLVAQSKLSTDDRERPRAHHLREQGRTRARRRLRLQDRAGRHRQGRLHRRASGRRRIHQRRHQVVRGSLQRPDVCGRSRRSASSARSLPRIYTKVTRVAPEKASELATAILDIGERMADAKSLDALDELQDELETILRRRGDRAARRHHLQRRAGYFKLGYEFVRDEIGMRRDHLQAAPAGRRTTMWWS